MVTEQQVREALSGIIDPDLGKDIVSLGFVKDIRIDGGRVSFRIELTTPACPLKADFERRAREAVAALPGIEEVHVEMTARPASVRRAAVEDSGLKEVRSLVAVSSCKGGVGKSTVAALLARTLAARGFAVGLLDADIYGPSVPTLFRFHEHGVFTTPDNKLEPLEIDGVKLISFGFLAGDGPAVLRGPLVARYIQQLLHQTAWGKLDYLFIDMPPGTGDIQLTLCQTAQMDGAVIVTTPHPLALADVRKGIIMFDKVNVPVLGVIENMAWFECDNCGKRHYLFGESGARTLERRFGLQTLAEIPVLGSLAASFESLLGTEYAEKAADAVVRALGRRSAEAVRRPKISFDATHITLSWPDGTVWRIPNRALRAACGCASCVDEMSGERLLDPEKIPADIQPRSVSVVGNYAIAVEWSDGHDSGYYPYTLLETLREKEA